MRPHYRDDQSSRLKPRGFTLVEVMVGIVLSTLLLILAGGLVSQSMNLSRRSVEIASSEGGLTIAMGSLCKDLESLAVRRTKGSYLEVKQEDVLVYGGKRLRVATLYLNTISETDAKRDDGEQRSNDDGISQPVCYRIAFQDVFEKGGEHPAVGLYRSVFRDTSEGGKLQKVIFERFLNTTDLSGTWSNNGVSTPDIEDVMLLNVVDFKVSFFSREHRQKSRNTGGESEAVNRQGDGLGDVSVGALETYVNGLGLQNERLSSVELLLTVMDEVGTKMLASNPSLLDQNDFYKKHTRTQIRRVTLPDSL